MIIFSISIVMAVILCSYYFDIGERYSEADKHIGDSEFYDVTTYIDEDYCSYPCSVNICWQIYIFLSSLTYSCAHT